MIVIYTPGGGQGGYGHGASTDSAAASRRSNARGASENMMMDNWSILSCHIRLGFAPLLPTQITKSPTYARLQAQALQTALEMERKQVRTCGVG